MLPEEGLASTEYHLHKYVQYIGMIGRSVVPSG